LKVEIKRVLKLNFTLNSKMTPFHLNETNVDQPTNTSKDPLHVPDGPMTQSKKEELNALD
jgi:hypothetical protein